MLLAFATLTKPLSPPFLLPFYLLKECNQQNIHNFLDASDQSNYQKAEDRKADDESIETIEGFVEDVDAGELFKAWK